MISPFFKRQPLGWSLPLYINFPSFGLRRAPGESSGGPAGGQRPETLWPGTGGGFGIADIGKWHIYPLVI